MSHSWQKGAFQPSNLFLKGIKKEKKKRMLLYEVMLWLEELVRGHLLMDLRHRNMGYIKPAGHTLNNP